MSSFIALNRCFSLLRSNDWERGSTKLQKKIAIMSNNNLVRHAMCRTHHHHFGQSLYQWLYVCAFWLGNIFTKILFVCQFEFSKSLFHSKFHLIFGHSWVFFFFSLDDLSDSGMNYFRHFAAFCRCVVHLWSHTHTNHCQHTNTTA